MKTTFDGFKNVLVIETRVDIRSTIRDTLKDLGIPKITAASTVQEGWSILEKMEGSPPDWIITDIESDQKVTAFHLLALVLNEPRLLRTRVSFIVSETEKDLLPAAFELGLLSCCMLPFTKMTLFNALDRLIKNLSTNYDLHCLTAAEYLREYLNAAEDYPSLILLEESLLLRFPNVPSCFLKLAEAQILNGQNDLARRTLWQAKHLGADLKIGVKQLQDLVDADNSGENQPADDKNFAKTFGLKNALIVDSDSTVVTQVESILRQIGIDEIVVFADGDAAANWIGKNDLPGLIIQEWKLPKLSGAALVQRIVKIGVKSTSLVVLSSLVQREDDPLMKEMGVSAVVSKPLIADDFLRTVMTALREDRFPTSISTIERKLRHALSAGDLALAQNLFSKIKVIKDVPAVNLMTLDAEISCAAGDHEKARDLALEALRSKGDTTILLNLLGKIYLRLGDNDSAFKCLNRAQQFSTKNLERLCLLAEVCSENGETGKAQEMLADAQALDKNNEQVVTATVNVALNSGDVKKAREVMLSMDSLSRVVSYMNNRAVILSRQGKVEESLELYKNALASVPDSCPTDRSILNYNLGLAYARTDHLTQAESYLSQVKLPENHPISKKAASLLARIRKVKATSGQLKLQLNTNVAKENSTKLSRPIALHATSGQLCLHLVYRSDKKYFSKIEALLKSMPRFIWHDGRKKVVAS